VDIGGVLRHIPNDLFFATKKSRHTSLPYLVISNLYHQSVEDPNPVLGTPSLDL
jgi:hypothetical protein